jgi:hypothetical protein
MAVMSALLAGRSPFTTRKFPDAHFCRSCVDRGAIVRLESLGQLKDPMTSSGIESSTFRLVAGCLNHMWYCMHLHIGGTVLNTLNILLEILWETSVSQSTRQDGFKPS